MIDLRILHKIIINNTKPVRINFIADEFEKIAAEADSFVGQTPPKEASPLGLFQPTAPGVEADPFAAVRQPDHGSVPPNPIPGQDAPASFMPSTSQAANPLLPPGIAPPTSQYNPAQQAATDTPPRGKVFAQVTWLLRVHLKLHHLLPKCRFTLS